MFHFQCATVESLRLSRSSAYGDLFLTNGRYGLHFSDEEALAISDALIRLRKHLFEGEQLSSMKRLVILTHSAILLPVEGMDLCVMDKSVLGGEWKVMAPRGLYCLTFERSEAILRVIRRLLDILPR